MNGHVLKVRQKIVLLTCGTLLVALGFIAYTSYYFVDEIMHQEAVKTLDAETEAFKNSAA